VTPPLCGAVLAILRMALGMVVHLVCTCAQITFMNT
jgi:hypothetical protein